MYSDRREYAVTLSGLRLGGRWGIVLAALAAEQLECVEQDFRDRDAHFRGVLQNGHALGGDEPETGRAGDRFELDARADRHGAIQERSSRTTRMINIFFSRPLNASELDRPPVGVFDDLPMKPHMMPVT